MSLTVVVVSCRRGDEAVADTHPVETNIVAEVVPKGPPPATMEPVVRVEFERVEALELLGMTLAHLNAAENSAELSPRIPLLMTIRDKLAYALREEM